MAAAPLNVEMAVPVDAVPTAATIAVVAPDAATPPATPAAALLNPPRSAFAPINNFLNSSESKSGRSKSVSYTHLRAEYLDSLSERARSARDGSERLGRGATQRANPRMSRNDIPF